MPLATTPRVWVVGETVTAAYMNAEIQNQFVALGAGVIPVVPKSSAALGTVTVATTETLDAVLGNYVFTAVAGHRYRACVDGAGLSGSVAADLFRVIVRNGGASTPTSASTAVASTAVYIPAVGGPGQTGFTFGGTFIPGAGTQTLSIFYVRINGTGVGTPTNNGVNRELYVIDLGTV